MKRPNPFTIISDEISQDLSVVGGFVRRYGLDGFELRSLNGRAFKDLTKVDVEGVGSLCRTEGWKIYGCATPIFKCAIDDQSAVGEHIDLFKRSLDVAKKLECNLVRVFSFLRTTELSAQSKIEQIADYLRQLAELARGYDVTVGLENESSCLIGSGEELQRICPLLPRQNCGIIWDPCNALYMDESSDPVTAVFPSIFSRVAHIHVKDAIRRPSSKPIAVPVGLGDVNWRRHFSAIRSSGYRGRLSLETHWRVEALDETLLHLPAGFAFSRGGEEASVSCLHNCLSLWEAAI